ncbi:MAG: hypothetical protein ACREJC_07750, partial [Tepidisphaeraceae bacterium]
MTSISKDRDRAGHSCLFEFARINRLARLMQTPQGETHPPDAAAALYPPQNPDAMEIRMIGRTLGSSCKQGRSCT